MRKYGLGVLTAACCVALASTAVAQSGGTAGYYQGFSSPAKGCAPLHYAFRGTSATPTGYVWFGDGSGMSKATGTMDL